jgi:hypothetical protein
MASVHHCVEQKEEILDVMVKTDLDLKILWKSEMNMCTHDMKE